MNRRKALQTLLQTIGGLTAGFFTTRHARAAAKAVPSNLPPASEGLIDSFSHFSNLSILDFLENNGGPRPHVFRRLFTHPPTLIDAQQRIALMDELGVDRSVLVPLPWLETAPAVQADPSLAAQAARRFNDDLAGVVARRPDRFTEVALLPTTNTDGL